MARKIYGVDDDGNQVSMTVSDNCTVSIEDIPMNQEWQLQMVNVNGSIITKDINELAVINEHIGGRPNDRK